MLTRRDKLLNRPWQLRRYNNHRKKVLTALPVIDFGPPPERHHVSCKLKKHQREAERLRKIEEDNFKLLQRMGDIMKKNRLENHWDTPLPNFLHRVGIYHRTRSSTPYQEITDSPQSVERTNSVSGKRKGCTACLPAPDSPPRIPEARVPWTPPRSRLSRRRSSSVIPNPHSEFDIQSLVKLRSKTAQGGHSLPSIEVMKRSRSVSSTCRFPTERNEKTEPKTHKRIVLKQGCLSVSFKFPADAELQILTGE